MTEQNPNPAGSTKNERGTGTAGAKDSTDQAQGRLVAAQVPPVFNFAQWIEDNQDKLVPPVNNKEMYPGDDDLIVMVVGGPNARHDFHFEPYPEFFYQYKGNMHVNIQTDEGLQRIDVREGEMWLLPANTWHSPQRPEEGSIGIVVEMVRPQGTTEHFGWFCLECNYQIRDVELQLNDIAVDLPPVFEEFYNSSEEERTCAACGAVHPGRA